MEPGACKPLDIVALKRNDKKTLLATTRRIQFPRLMNSILKELLKGSVVTLEEVAVRLKPPTRITLWVFPDGTMDPNTYVHVGIRVKSKRGDKAWGVDLKAANTTNFCRPCPRGSTF